MIDVAITAQPRRDRRNIDRELLEAIKRLRLRKQIEARKRPRAQAREDRR